MVHSISHIVSTVTDRSHLLESVVKLGATRCADGGRETVQVLDLRADFADCECVRHNLTVLVRARGTTRRCD